MLHCCDGVDQMRILRDGNSRDWEIFDSAQCLNTEIAFGGDITLAEEIFLPACGSAVVTKCVGYGSIHGAKLRRARGDGELSLQAEPQSVKRVKRSGEQDSSG